MKDLTSLGYSEQEVMSAWNEYKKENETSLNPLMASYNKAMSVNQDPRMNSSNSMFKSPTNENLIQWQLELDSILERIEHMLRGDVIKFEQGHMVWMKTTNPQYIIFNDHGVTEIMRILSMYLNRNTILSNYDEATINDKMLDLGKEIADLIFLKYDAMGLDTLEKRKLYPILTREIVDVVHSAYLRALHGGERQSLREARQVAQSEQIQPNAMYPGFAPRKERSILNPLRWLGGKYK